MDCVRSYLLLCQILSFDQIFSGFFEEVGSLFYQPVETRLYFLFRTRTMKSLRENDRFRRDEG